MKKLQLNGLILFFLIILSSVVSSQNTEADIISGGLGLSKEAWEVKQGKPDSKCPISIVTCYSSGNYMVSFMNNYIWTLEINVQLFSQTSNTKGISIKESRSISKQFIPADSKLIRTYKSQSGSTVDLYMSESLKSLETSFPAKEFQIWTDGEQAGIFIVIHSGKDSIKRIVIGTGNNP